MTEINHSQIQHDLSQWKEVLDHARWFASQHKDLVHLLCDQNFLITASIDAKRTLLITLWQAAESYGLDTIASEINWVQQNDSSEQLSESMDESYITRAIERSKSYANDSLNTPKDIRETCKKLKYTSEDLWNGRTKHNLNGHGFITPKTNEFRFLDMKNKDGKYTMDTLEQSTKYQNFQAETGAKDILKPIEVFAMLWEIATAMGISETIDANFFKSNNDSDWLWRKLLQMFRNITWFEGRIPIDILNLGYVNYLSCRSGDCWFNDYSFDVSGDVGFLSRLYSSHDPIKDHYSDVVISSSLKN